jgi:ubiquinone/menaquinone biosynthesis C-methylase UbiE
MIFDIPSKKQIAAAFSAKARGYRSDAFIQHQILCRLVPLVETAGRFHLPWLDAGCGAGGLGAMLKKIKVHVKLVKIDLAFAMLRLARGTRMSGSPAVQSDIEAMPFASCMFGGVVASSVLQWLPRQDLGLREIHRVLSPGGALVFSVFLRGSFCQLFSLRQDRNLGIPLRLQSKEGFASRMRASRFSSLRLATFEEEYYFPSALGVMKYLSGIGSTAVSGRRLLRKEILALCCEYEERFATTRGVPLTVRVAYGTAIKAL